MPRVAWKSFTEARAVVRGLKLKGCKEWREWSKSGHRPSDIPAHPETTYRDDGWTSWPDWLGNGKERVAWRNFTDGRAVGRGLELKSKAGWHAWSKSDQRPSDIPGRPDKAYRDDGWISWPDWLGFEVRVLAKDMLPFAVGRAYARKLKLRSEKEWREWSKSGRRPSDIPAGPHKTYRDDGWVSWPDWLGSEERVLAKDMLPFAVARAYARKLKLRSKTEWEAWSKSGQRPSDIPCRPDRTYRDDGWISTPDWLGYGSERGAAASRASSSSSSATTAPKKKTKKKRKRRPTPTHPSDLPPPPPPSTSPSKPTKVKTEPPSSKSSGGSSDRSTEPPLRKIKKEEDA
jgi:hypothetical protein